MICNTKPEAFFEAVRRAASARKHSEKISNNAHDEGLNQSAAHKKAAGISEVERLFRFYDALCAKG